MGWESILLTVVAGMVIGAVVGTMIYVLEMARRLTK